MTPLRSLVLLAVLVVSTVLPALGSAFAPPVVVVYPLTFSGAIAGTEAGSDVALILAQKISDGGGVTVRPAIPGTDRVHYLEAAQSQRADYYITGFLQPIGQDVSMIVQVVSTYSGSVVFSTTSTIRTFGDAGSQADALREAIIRHAGRGLASLDTPAQASTAPSSAPTNGPGVNLTRALRKRQKATPSPSASPAYDSGLTPVSEIERPSATPSATSSSDAAVATAAVPPRVTPAPAPTPAASASARARTVASVPAPVADRPSSTVMVIDASGGEDPDTLAAASDALMTALRRSGIAAARLPISFDDLLKNAASVCRANAGMRRFYAPTIVLGHDDSGAPEARLSVASIGCDGATLATRTTSGFGNARGGYPFAIDRAATKMVPLLSDS